MLGLSKMHAVRFVIACNAGLWLAMFYTLLRLISCRRLDSVILSLVVVSSAGAMFWSAVPETYLLGSLTILGVLILSAAAERTRIPAWLDLAVGRGLPQRPGQQLHGVAGFIDQPPSRAYRDPIRVQRTGCKWYCCGD